MIFLTYTELNAALVEHFGDLERLCNQIYHEHHGVTNYIEDMKAKEYRGIRYVPGWENTFRRLKEVRHKRNQLSHGELSFSDPCATVEDINFLHYFRQNILNQTDPLSMLRKKSQAIRKTQPKIAPSAPVPKKRVSGMTGVFWVLIIFIIIVIVSYLGLNG